MQSVSTTADSNTINSTNPWPVLDHGIPCSDAAGEVIATGSHVSRFQLGDRISPIFDQDSISGDEQTRQWLGGEIEGVLTSHIIIDEQTCAHIPDHLRWAEAACLPNAGVTAWSVLKNVGTRGLIAGQTVSLQGMGWWSMMTFKFTLAAGCKVIITSSNEDKLRQVGEMARRRQMVQTINHRTTPAWDDVAIELNGGLGVDIVVECGGTPSLLQSLKAVAKGGTISQVGHLSKQDPANLESFVPLLIDKTATLGSINVGSRRDVESMNKLIAGMGLRFEDVVQKVFSRNQSKRRLMRCKKVHMLGRSL